VECCEGTLPPTGELATCLRQIAMLVEQANLDLGRAVVDLKGPNMVLVRPTDQEAHAGAALQLRRINCEAMLPHGPIRCPLPSPALPSPALPCPALPCPALPCLSAGLPSPKPGMHAAQPCSPAEAARLLSKSLVDWRQRRNATCCLPPACLRARARASPPATPLCSSVSDVSSTGNSFDYETLLNLKVTPESDAAGLGVLMCDVILGSEASIYCGGAQLPAAAAAAPAAPAAAAPACACLAACTCPRATHAQGPLPQLCLPLERSTLGSPRTASLDH
jgi:hypothetical protein